MKKKFFTNLILLISLNLLVKPFWVFGIDRTVQNVVGTADYGFYFSLFNFSLVLNIILDFGLTNYNNRNISQHKQLLTKYFSNIVVLKFMLSVLYMILALGLGLIIGYSWEQFYLLIFLVFNQFLLSFILYLRSNISGLHLFRTDSLISVLDRFLMIIIVGVLLWTNLFGTDFQIEWFVYSQTIAYGITALLAFFVVMTKVKTIKLKFDKALLLLIFKQTFPFALLFFLMSFYNRFDGVLIERLLPNGDHEAGVYAQSFRLLDASSQFALLFSTLLLPIFAKMLKQKEPINELANFSFLLILTPGLILVIVSIFFRTEIMDLLYNDLSPESYTIFAILISAFIPISTTYIFGTLLTANGNLKYLNIMATVGVAINFGLNFSLIPILGAKGAAIASLATQLFTAVAQFFIAKKIFSLKVMTKQIISVVVFVVVFSTSVFFIHKYIENWILSFFISGILGVILGFTLKLMNLKTFYQILKYDK